MGKPVYLKEYDFNLAANGSAVILTTGEYFRIQSSNGAVSVSIDGLGELPGLLAGQGISNTPYQRLTLRDVSGAANVGKILVANDAFIDNRTYGVNALDAATIASLKLTTPRPETSTASFNSSAIVSASTAVTIFNAASNVNGALIQTIDFSEANGGSLQLYGFLAKASAPTTINDGEPILVFGGTGWTGTSYIYRESLKSPVLLAAGLGLHFFGNQATTAAGLRACRYRLL